ncbi:MAG: hypothetical protein JWQ35_1732, partial [Bacteriovoracaceae bacterium]|nr:hypothetical protein [Bacteriovoracaceae bacterium]
LLIPFENKIPPRVKMAAVAIVAILFTILLYQRHPDGSDMFAIQWPPLWYSYVKNKQISGFENMEFIIYILFALSMAGVLIWKKAKIDLVILALAIYFLLSLLFFAPGAWRFILSAGWIVMIASSLFQGADCEKISLKLKNGILFTVVALILLNLGLSSKQPRIIGPAMPVSALESNREILDQWLPKDAFVVAPLGVQFRVKYFLNRESARSSLPRQLDKTYSIKDLYEQGPPCAKMDAGKIDDLSKVHCFKLGKFWKITRGL